MANNTVRHINIIGHQNPDTDSICSALAYAWLKNRGSLTGLYEARRAGHVNRETRFVLQHFGVERRGFAPTSARRSRTSTSASRRASTAR